MDSKMQDRVRTLEQRIIDDCQSYRWKGREVYLRMNPRTWALLRAGFVVQYSRSAIGPGEAFHGYNVVLDTIVPFMGCLIEPVIVIPDG